MPAWACHTRKPLEEALCFGWIDGKALSYNVETYLVRFSPRKRNSHWTETNKKKALALIKAGRMAEPGLAAVQEAKRNGQWPTASKAEAKKVLPKTKKTSE